MDAGVWQWHGCKPVARGQPLSMRSPTHSDWGVTSGGRLHVEWGPAVAVTPLGQLPFFIEFLKVSGLFDAWDEDCPLVYQSNNAPDKRAVLATFVWSILAGHYRYARITAIRHDGIHPELLDVARLVSENSARQALALMTRSRAPGLLRRDVARPPWPPICSALS